MNYFSQIVEQYKKNEEAIDKYIQRLSELKDHFRALRMPIDKTKIKAPEWFDEEKLEMIHEAADGKRREALKDCKDKIKNIRKVLEEAQEWKSEFLAKLEEGSFDWMKEMSDNDKRWVFLYLKNELYNEDNMKRYKEQLEKEVAESKKASY